MDMCHQLMFERHAGESLVTQLPYRLQCDHSVRMCRSLISLERPASQWPLGEP
jgi:hypothetical protein